ncbi:acyl-CoA thioesterase/BAAT N-terminal domain-containing protein [Leekyejoonella antrihumi]|uniref:acyl-CoA thioesterase/BAAT N-terminal domain-containing protein n=1 Tax=Leekyejoonella antrihumi TaxID=1660198 RepID=UPI003CCC5641
MTSRATDDGGVRWKGSAAVRVPSDGVVSLGMPSTGGSYTGPNPMGLLDFMKPPKGSDQEAFRSFLS